MIDIKAAANVLGGEVYGNGILCPGFGHSKSDRSLRVTFSPNAPDGFTVHSFAGDDWQQSKDYVKKVFGISDKKIEVMQRAPLLSQDAKSKTYYAKRIWSESSDYLDTPAWNYLVSRGLSPVNTSALRYHHAAPLVGNKVPALIAAMVNAKTNEFQGIHRTRLNPKDKAMLGSSKGAVVKLSGDDSVISSLNICEGIETGIALMNMGYAPVWACLTAGGIAKFPVLEGIETLSIFADNDINNVGQNAAIECGVRWREAGKEVKAYAPNQSGQDFADGGAK